MIWYHMIDRKNLESTSGDHIEWRWNEGSEGDGLDKRKRKDDEDGLIKKHTSLDELKERWECQLEQWYCVKSVEQWYYVKSVVTIKTHQTDYAIINVHSNVLSSRKKNGRTQCTSLSRTTSTTIMLALDWKNSKEGRMHMKMMFVCFNNNGIYYEGQSMALWMKSHKEEYKETIFHHKAFFTLQVMARIKNLRNAI